MGRSAARLGLILTLSAGVYIHPADGAPIDTPQQAAGITWMMCEEPGNDVTFRQPAGTTDLVISCTQSKTVLTLRGCVGPRVKRDRATNRYTVSCNALIIEPRS